MPFTESVLGELCPLQPHRHQNGKSFIERFGDLKRICEEFGLIGRKDMEASKFFRCGLVTGRVIHAYCGSQFGQEMLSVALRFSLCSLC